MSARTPNSGKGGAIVGVSLLALLLVNALDTHGGVFGAIDPLAPYIGNIVFLLMLLAGIGRATNGYWLGVLIDNRNRVSLSRLQAAVWTVLVFAAYATVAAMRLHATGVGNALAIDIPPNLLAAMGISATSLMATPAILTMKTASPNSANADIRPADQTASLLDMVKGDDDTNYDTPDLGKIQHALITLLVTVFFAVLIAHWLGSGIGTTALPGPVFGGATALPDFESHVAWLLGISSAGYLGCKAVPHGPPDPAVGRLAEQAAAAPDPGTVAQDTPDTANAKGAP